MKSKVRNSLPWLWMAWVLVGVGIACNLSRALDGADQPSIPEAITPTVEIELPTEQPPVDQPVGGPTQAAGVGNTNAELATATVQIVALQTMDGNRDMVWTGSGSIISPDGLVLTNAHVVDDRYDEYDVLGVAITGRTDEPPDLRYLAEISAVDYALDLAVIRIISDLDGNPVQLDLPYVELGDSDQIEIGTKLRILGYPGIGGETITFTEGAVSGFTQERGVEGRAWIKTDATIAGGNSGGMAVNPSGKLIGVPTRASSGAGGEIVDCRPVADTNRDGIVDEHDTCVPIGGFINGLRPINLALPLIEAARQGRQYAGDIPSERPTGDVNVDEIVFFNLEFADGVTEDDQPTQLWYALPAGTNRICAFWDYAGMSDGLQWSAYWFVNGELSEGGSILNNTWTGGAEGNWWVCIFDETSLEEGLYELALEVEGETLVSDAIFLGGDRTVVDFIIENESSVVLCFVQLSPSGAQNWGQDELDETEVIDPGQSRAIPIATGQYDLRILDCEAQVLIEEYDIMVEEALIYTVSDQ